MNAFLTGNELKEALTILPQYDDRIRNATTGERLLALNNLFNLYYPSPMAAEMSSKKGPLKSPLSYILGQ